ncbi:MAG: DUF1211 domain-containing protein [Candidatus Omnitrophica bacterium]|nr:DUF1211 domain-containing protein [Candidatus Omnitrophota bacterium]MCB9748051.1 DUF1211 domain-containing protein [Candidatus Omnitrophota bacterium]
MDKNRMEAFSDGVIAIIITIMVLEMKAPHGTSWKSLEPVFPAFLSYILSFTYLAIYWNNHHHLLKAVKEVDGRVLWANLHLLFWLSLIPFASAWMGENHFAQIPVILYGIDLLCAAVSYQLLVQALLARHGRESLLAKAIGKDVKGKISIVIYILAIGVSFLHPLWACFLYALVAVMWIVPDQRIERVLK